VTEKLAHSAEVVGGTGHQVTCVVAIVETLIERDIAIKQGRSQILLDPKRTADDTLAHNEFEDAIDQCYHQQHHNIDQQTLHIYASALNVVDSKS